MRKDASLRASDPSSAGVAVCEVLDITPSLIAKELCRSSGENEQRNLTRS